MKNIHILPTENSSKLSYNKDGVLELHRLQWRKNTQNIYITSDEEIKEGDWFVLDMSHSSHPNEIHQMGNDNWSKTGGIHFCEGNSWIKSCKKIILTTDQDLIKNGVQAIDDEFLEWFVKNPSCKEIEVKWTGFYKPVKNEETDIPEFDCYEYKVIIPKEEPKQIYYNTVGRENGEFVIKGQFNTQKEALDLANELNRKFPELYYDWNKTLVKEEPKQRLEKYSERFDNDKSPIGNPDTWGKRIVEEPKQETLEEVAKEFFRKFKHTHSPVNYHLALVEFAKWQQERMYEIMDLYADDVMGGCTLRAKEWFEQFKKNKI
jgi:hypothetical protein